MGWALITLMDTGDLVMLESPYAATPGRSVKDNVAYARLCMIDSVTRGEVPFATHLLWTQRPDGGWAGEKNGATDAEHWLGRDKALAMGNAWREWADMTVLYVDFGVTPGMERAEQAASNCGQRTERRRLFTPEQSEDEKLL